MQDKIEITLRELGPFELVRWKPEEGASLLTVMSTKTSVKYTHYFGSIEEPKVLSELRSWIRRFVFEREAFHASNKSSTKTKNRS